MARLASLVLAIALVVGACTSSSPPDPTLPGSGTATTATTQPGEEATETTIEEATDTSEVPTSGESITVVVDALRAVALADTMARFTADTGVAVVLDVQTFDEIRSRADDPDVDIFMGPHVWRDELEAGGFIVAAVALEPVWSNQAVDAFLGAGSRMMAVPFSAESLVLYRNTELVPDVVVDLADGCQNDDVACIAMPGFGEAAGYHLTPFLMSEANRSIDDVLANPSPGPLADLVDLVNNGVVSLGSIRASRDDFLTGRAALFVGGPWDLGPIEDSGIPFVVQYLPPLRGRSLAAPAAVQGFYLSATAPHGAEAEVFLADYLASATTQTDLWLRDRRAPVHLLVEPDELASAFATGVNDGFLLPQADLEVYWEELGVAAEAMYAGADPVAAVTAAAARIEERLR